MLRATWPRISAEAVFSNTRWTFAEGLNLPARPSYLSDLEKARGTQYRETVSVYRSTVSIRVFDTIEHISIVYTRCASRFAITSLYDQYCRATTNIDDSIDRVGSSVGSRGCCRRSRDRVSSGVLGRVRAWNSAPPRRWSAVSRLVFSPRISEIVTYECFAQSFYRPYGDSTALRLPTTERPTSSFRKYVASPKKFGNLVRKRTAIRKG